VKGLTVGMGRIARRHSRQAVARSARQTQSRGDHLGNKTDKRKQSLYFSSVMLDEIAAEARRLDRSLSWVVQRAWKIGREAIKKMPGA
jgi:uncharacterized small protein (TIGR04563 family)